MHLFAAVLDTRLPGSRRGVAQTCNICGREHYVWVCFRGIDTVTLRPSGETLVTGTACARKVAIPIFQEQQFARALEEVPVTRANPRWERLFEEFRPSPD